MSFPLLDIDSDIKTTLDCIERSINEIEMVMDSPKEVDVLVSWRNHLKFAQENLLKLMNDEQFKESVELEEIEFNKGSDKMDGISYRYLPKKMKRPILIGLF